MSDFDVALLAWAVTATVAACFYYAGREKHKIVATMLVTAMKAIASGNAKAWIDNDNNLRIKAYDTQGN